MLGEYDTGYENCINSMVKQVEDMQFCINQLNVENAKLREQLQYDLKEKNAKLRELAENLLMGFIYLETPQRQQDCIDCALHLRHELGVLPMEKLNAYELGIEVD